MTEPTQADEALVQRLIGIWEGDKPDKVSRMNQSTAAHARAAREEGYAKAIEDAAQAAENAGLPSNFHWGEDAMESFNFGKKRAADAIRQLGRPQSFQDRVQAWFYECFSPEVCNDRQERGDRFLEEVLELLQSNGYDPSRVETLRDYVWNRPAGEPDQETGGVMVTLAAYCIVHQLDMMNAGERELTRITDPAVMNRIRAKQESKRGLHTPLPVPPGDPL